MILVIVLSGCVDRTPEPVYWRDNYPVAARTDDSLPELSRQAFERRIKTDVARWSTALIEYGCPAPFYYADAPGAGKVWLVPRDRWVGGEGGQWVGTGEVYIRALLDGTLDTYADDPTWTIGLHELGHAIGLGHSEYIDSSPSIMTPASPSYVDPASPLPERDIHDAACILGCGPCD